MWYSFLETYITLEKTSMGLFMAKKKRNSKELIRTFQNWYRINSKHQKDLQEQDVNHTHIKRI